MMKKYQLTDNTLKIGERTLYQIQALVDIPQFHIKKGELGGYIEREENLSHEGAAWIRLHSKVYENAKVYGDACVAGAEVFGNAEIFDNAETWAELSQFGEGGGMICGNAKIYGNAQINTGGRLYICDEVEIFGESCISSWHSRFSDKQFSGKVKIGGESRIFTDRIEATDNVQIFDSEIYAYDLRLQDNVALLGGRIEGKPTLKGNVQVLDKALIAGNAHISGNSRIGGDTEIHGDACLPDNADIQKETDLFWATNVGNWNATLTVYKSREGLLVHHQNEFAAEWGEPDWLYSPEEFLVQCAKHYAPKEVREFELLIEVAKSRILGGKDEK